MNVLMDTYEIGEAIGSHIVKQGCGKGTGSHIVKQGFDEVLGATSSLFLLLLLL